MDYQKLKTLETLEPAGGKLYAHVFENRATGMRRGLYWALSIDLEPLVNAGESWDCNIQCEWLTWNIKRWTELDGLGLSDLLLPELAESSLYLAEHQPTTLEALRIRRRAGSKFDVSLTVVGDIQLPHGQDRFATRISQTALVDFDGVYVVTDNLFPKPDTADEAARVVDQFLRSDDSSRQCVTDSGTCSRRSLPHVRGIDEGTAPQRGIRAHARSEAEIRAAPL